MKIEIQGTGRDDRGGRCHPISENELDENALYTTRMICPISGAVWISNY